MTTSKNMNASRARKKPVAPPSPAVAIDVYKVGILCLLSGGLYQLLWFYRQWQAALPEQTSMLHIGFYALFSSISCIGLVRRYNLEYGLSYAAAYLVLPTALINLPKPWYLLSYLALTVPIVLVQKTLNETMLSSKNPERRLSLLEIVFTLVGGAVVVSQILQSSKI